MDKKYSVETGFKLFKFGDIEAAAKVDLATYFIDGVETEIMHKYISNACAIFAKVYESENGADFQEEFERLRGKYCGKYGI